MSEPGVITLVMPTSSNIPNLTACVPMMFRAQVPGRCQLQRIDPLRTKAEAAQADRYCGRAVGQDFQPGILRFHGGYPTSPDWTDGLVDIIHPQQDRQVKQEQTTSAFAQISLYQPQLRFTISSTEPLEVEEWETIWHIWEQTLAHGLGCRVSAGYGHSACPSPVSRTADPFS